MLGFWSMTKTVLLAQYANIGGQAIIEGVMMRSPNAFVIAIRLQNGKIRLRSDQWFGLAQKHPIFQKPFFRGIILLVEAMFNGIFALNYSSQVAINEEKHNQDLKLDWAIIFSIALSFVFAIFLFVFIPHATTVGLSQAFSLGWSLKGFSFHFFDGLVKAGVLIFYIYLIGRIPDVKRVFEYHGAEHKAIATFEAGDILIPENAKKFSRFHPRCGTSFVFFVLFVSIVLYSSLFSMIELARDFSFIEKHVFALFFKIIFVLPIAGISYEILKLAGKYPSKKVFKIISFPGLLLQRLTTNEPDLDQLEVALSSIKTVLSLEEKNKLNEIDKKVLNVEEVDIKDISELERPHSTINDFLES